MDLNKGVKEMNKNVSISRRLLLDKPLYDYADGKRLRVLVAGEADISIEFAGTVLELSQTGEFYPEVTVISQTACKYNEGLSDFIRIDGKGAKKQNLGSLNLRIFSDSFAEELKAEKYDYVFIAFRDDGQNKVAAEEILNSGILSDKAAVNVLYKEVPPEISSAYSFSYDYTIENYREYDYIVRCAFNTHLIWESSMSDIDRIISTFNEELYRSSSISNVVSLKYKLHSLGIDFSEESAEKSASEIKKKIESLGKRFLGKMAEAEHKRWIINMLFSGWNSLENVDELPYGDTKNRTDCLNCCLRPSNSVFKLQTHDWHPSKGKWENASEEELKKLDSMDRMSVEMHRHFKIQAEEIRKDDIDYLFGKIRMSLYRKNDIRKVSILDAYRTSIDGLFENLKKYSKGKLNTFVFYDKLLKAEFESDRYKKEKDLLSEIGLKLSPLTNFCKYTDWKCMDLQFLYALPFILTNNNNIHICTPLAAGDSKTQLFKNAALGLMLNPDRITYMADARALSCKDIAKSIDYVCEIMDNHSLQTKVSVAVFCGAKDGSFEKLKLHNKRVDSVECYSRDEIGEFLKSKENCFDFFETNNTNISGYTETLIDFNKIDIRVIGFNMLSMEFEGCEYLNYIPDNLRPTLNLSDIIFVKGTKIKKYSEPGLQTEYEKLWEMFSKNSGCDGEKARKIWKALCNICKNETYKKCKIAKVSGLNNALNGETVTHSYSLPNSTMENTEKILHSIKFEKGKALNRWSVKKLGGKRFELTVKHHPHLSKFYDQIFKVNAGCLQSSPVKLVFEADSITVSSETLTCYADFSEKYLSSKCQLEDADKNKPRELLNELKKAGFISTENEDGDKVSFVCKNAGIKDVLTNEGRLLEVYVYYKALEQGRFDEVYNGIEINWNDYSIFNEIDILLIKGLEMTIVECKCRGDSEKSFYDTLNSLGSVLGINYKTLLIQYFGDKISDYNKKQMSRGKLFRNEIITVSSEKKISNIGAVLSETL